MANTPPILTSLSPVSTGPTSVGQGQNPPLPQLPAGTVLQGTVTGKDASGNLLIKTDTLRLVLNTNYPVQKGAQVAVRLDQTLASHLSKTAPPPVHITSVDGKTANPLPVAPNPAAPPPSNAQQELAKPIGLLLDVFTRTGTAGKTAASQGDAAPAQQHAQARGVASEVTLSEGTRATAVLLRPAVSQRAANLLMQLNNQVSAPLSNSANALRAGLQLQVQVTQTPVSTAPVSGNATPATPASAMPPSAAPTAPAATPAATPAPDIATSTQPTAQQRSGYASYARQAPAMLSGSPPNATSPAPTGGQLPTPSGQPAATPASGGNAATPMPASTSAPAPAPAGSPVAPNPAPTTTVTHAAAQTASPATPVNIPQNLTPQVVEQLLARAEALPMPQGQIAAVVMGKEPTGALIVQTRLGMFTLPQVQAEGAGQPGSVLTWQVRGLTPANQAPPTMPMSGAGGLVATAAGMTSELSAMHELTSVLQSMQGSMAAQALQRVVPHVGSQLGAGLLFFVSVLRKGDVGEWLGRDLISQLEKMGKGDLIARLGGDLAAVRSLFIDQQPGSWQALFFPVMVDKELEHAQMFLKQELDDEKKKGNAGTRFVVELDLSNMGPMQIDGLIKKREASTQFDMVLRTMTELPDTIKTDIFSIFDNAQKAAGFNGAISFRMVSEFPVHPLEEMQQSGQGEAGSIIA